MFENNKMKQFGIGKNKISRTGARSIKEIVKLAKLINNNKYLNYKGITTKYKLQTKRYK